MIKRERNARGYVPAEMEDKWFIYFERVVCFTDPERPPFGLKLDGSPSGVRIVEA